MNKLNSIIIEGNVKEVKKDEKKVSISIVYEAARLLEDGKKDTEYNLFEVYAYGKLAYACEKWVEIDREIRVVGRLKNDSYKDDSGCTRIKTVVIAEHIEFKPVKAN